MVEIELTKALRAFLEKVVCNFRLQTKGGEELKPPKIVNGYLPPKRSGADDDFPFIIVRPAASNVEREAEQIKVNLIIGCYSEEYDGYEYCLNVLSRIKQELVKLPSETLAEKYQLNFPLSWSLEDEQPWPQWIVELETNWTFRSTQNFDDF